MKYDNLILFDYFSFTAKHHSVQSLIGLLGLDLMKFEQRTGVRGYRDRLLFEGVTIHAGGREEVWCEMSGQGCRAYETYGKGDWAALFEEVLSDSDYNITRLDAAFDDHIGLIDLDHMMAECRAGNYVSKMNWWNVSEGTDGRIIRHGSPQSAIRFRVYDKAYQLNREDEGHWVRFEIQMRDKHARRFLDLMILQGVGEVFAKTVNNYLRYVVPGEDTNKVRWKTAGWWYRFIHTSEKISLYEKPGTEYNIDNLERYVIDQAGAATAAYVKIVGVPSFVEKCQAKLEGTKNPKYKHLIALYAPEYITEEGEIET